MRKGTGGFWFDQEGKIFSVKNKVPEKKVLSEINYYDEIPIVKEIITQCSCIYS